MARTIDDVIAGLPAKRRAAIEKRASELASTLRGLRHASAQTQQDVAGRLGVGQDTVSRIERRNDMLISTLRRYVQSIGGELELVVRFPDRAPLVIEQPVTRAVKGPRLRTASRSRRGGRGANAGAG